MYPLCIQHNPYSFTHLVDNGIDRQILRLRVLFLLCWMDVAMPPYVLYISKSTHSQLHDEMIADGDLDRHLVCIFSKLTTNVAKSCPVTTRKVPTTISFLGLRCDTLTRSGRIYRRLPSLGCMLQKKLVVELQ